MITVLRCVVLALLFSASVQAETTAPDQKAVPAAAKPAPAVAKASVAKAPAAKSPLVFPQGSGVMHIPLAGVKKPLDVFTYQPVGADETTPVIMVMTGVDRNAATYRNDWMTVASSCASGVVP